MVVFNLKSFIKNEENIISEIINNDYNYVQASLSFVEKTLKEVANDNVLTVFELIDKYIIDYRLDTVINNDNKEVPYTYSFK